MTLDFNAITAGAAVVAALVAIYAIWSESKRSRSSQGVELLFRMNDQFNNRDFRRSRRAAAGFLRKNQICRKSESEVDVNVSTESISSVELDEVLDFFEVLATLVRKKLFDNDLTSNYFFYWLDCYYILAQDYIAFWRQSWPQVWDDIDWLRRYLIKVENKKANHGYIAPSPESLQIFLNDECDLDVD